eukprot:133914_1
MYRPSCYDTFVLDITTSDLFCPYFEKEPLCSSVDKCLWDSYYNECYVATGAPTTLIPTKYPTTALPTTNTFSPTTAIPTTPTTDPTTSIPTATTLSPTKKTRDITRKQLIMTQVTSIQSTIGNSKNIKLVGTTSKKKRPCNKCDVFISWTDLNGLLDDDDIVAVSKTDAGSRNLELDSGALESGQSYSFQMTVNEVPMSRRRRLVDLEDDNYTLSDLGFGQSSAIDIFIINGPTIHENSFQIEPTCVKYYYSILDMMSTAHSLTLLADDDHDPLLYQFGYIYNELSSIPNYFHAGVLSEP